MVGFTNKNVKKEANKKLIYVFICIIVIVASFLFRFGADKQEKTANAAVTDLNSVIVAEEEKEDRKSYLDVASIPYEFAVSDETVNSYYIVSDGRYLYIVFMGPGDFASLNKEDITTNAIRVNGITAKIPNEIKSLALDAYNYGLSDEEKITLDDFDSYFGSVYLDMTKEQDSTTSMFETLFFITLIAGAISLIVTVYNLFKFRRSIKKLDMSTLQELDMKMNDEKSFYYDKAHLYLTDTHVITFADKVSAIDYNDIIWMYPFERRTNGIRTGKAIKIMTNKGKTYTLAYMELITKAKKEIYDEIWNTIVSKNNNMLLGHTEENIKLAKERVIK